MDIVGNPLSEGFKAEKGCTSVDTVGNPPPEGFKAEKLPHSGEQSQPEEKSLPPSTLNREVHSLAPKPDTAAHDDTH